MRAGITPEDFRNAQKAAGLSNSACAAALHCTPRAVAHWRAGKRPVCLGRYELLLRKFLPRTQPLLEAFEKLAAHPGVKQG